MDKSLYLAAMKGNVDFLSEVREREIESGCCDNFFQSLTPQENNIIHIAIQYDQFDFLKFGFNNNLQIFSPLMISQRNAKGDTPIHVASKRGNKKIVELLLDIAKKSVFREVSISSEVVEDDDHEGETWAWRVRNSEGNTPLHEALINGKLEVAKCLLRFDSYLATIANNSQETPLHLAIRYSVDGDKKLAINTIEQLNKKQASLSYKVCFLAEESESMIILLLQKHKGAVSKRDKDGLTPLHRAAVQSHRRAIEVILIECPDSSEMCDPNGKTILHLVKFESYEEAKKYLEIPQILALKDHQDDEGNTPSHVAVMDCIAKSYEEAKKYMESPRILVLKDQQDDKANGNTIEEAHVGVMDCLAKSSTSDMALTSHDIGGIKALLEASANFTLKNKEGHSAASLISQQLKSHFSNKGTMLKLGDKKMKKMSTTNNKAMKILVLEEMIEKNNDKWSKVELKTIREAVINGDVLVLRKEFETLGECLLDGIFKVGDFYCLLKGCRICCEQVEEFMTELLEKIPMLVNQTNFQGDTLLHTMAKEGCEMSESFLHVIKRCYEKAQAQAHHDDDGLSDGGVFCPPWTVKNKEGNTSLHEVLLHAPDLGVIRFLIECDKDACSYVNNKRETPLHTLCHSQAKEKITEDMIKMIILENISATYMRDAYGLTPLLQAATNGRIEIVKQICLISPESAQLRDYEGQNLWHKIDMSGMSTEEEKEIIDWFSKNTKLIELASSEDIVGKIPLCEAIKRHSYNRAQVLMRITNKKDIYKDNELWEDKLGTIYNFSMLRLARFLHPKMEQTLWKKLEIIGERSIFGIPEKDINYHTNTISVVAVLLATIALTGALQVPGGFDDDGHPNLLNADRNVLVRAAFWVFMVSDIITMCLSIMVLYCLLWVITGDKQEKLVITDLTVVLLQWSFITTMVTLMMGVFASTFEKSEELAVFTLVVCSSVLLLLQKWIVMKPLQYLLISGYLVKELIFEVIKDFCSCRKKTRDVNNNK